LIRFTPVLLFLIPTPILFKNSVEGSLSYFHPIFIFFTLPLYHLLSPFPLPTRSGVENIYNPSTREAEAGQK
jgi:hypothetical protein